MTYNYTSKPYHILSLFKYCHLRYLPLSSSHPFPKLAYFNKYIIDHNFTLIIKRVNNIILLIKPTTIIMKNITHYKISYLFTGYNDTTYTLEMLSSILHTCYPLVITFSDTHNDDNNSIILLTI